MLEASCSGPNQPDLTHWITLLYFVCHFAPRTGPAPSYQENFMKFLVKLFSTMAIAVLVTGMAGAATAPHYLITNNDNSQGNTAGFYTISGGSLLPSKLIATGGTGNDGIGNVATKRVSILKNSTQSCAFISNADSGDISGIDINTLTLTGTFKGASGDNGSTAGIGIVSNGTYLYANFTASKNLGAFLIGSGCTLTFLGDTPAVGLTSGTMLDMAANSSILVASFNDGSIGSFNVSQGMAVSNNDLQYPSGHSQGYSAAGVDLSRDGHFAVFGAAGNTAAADVSDVSSGALAATQFYANLGPGGGVASILLSPNNALLYFGEFSSQRVAAAFFDAATGTLTPGCSDAENRADDVAGLALGSTAGSGGVLYDAEIENLVGIFRVTVSGSTCALAESPNSPVLIRNTITLESIGAYPPRSF